MWSDEQTYHDFFFNHSLDSLNIQNLNFQSKHIHIHTQDTSSYLPTCTYFSNLLPKEKKGKGKKKKERAIHMTFKAIQNNGYLYGKKKKRSNPNKVQGNKEK